MPDTPDANVQLEFYFNSTSGVGNGTPIVGASVHACNELDILCSSPLSPATSDDAGIALLTIPGGFAGYYEVEAQGFSNTVLARTPQLSSEYQSQGLANLMLLSEGAGLAGLTQNPDLSIAIVTAADCTSTPAAGIVFNVGNPGMGEQVVYLNNDLPLSSQTQTDSVSGTAVIFNVPAGTLTVTASFAATNRPIRTLTALARENWATYMTIRPDQATHMPIPSP